ncbi:hypothetical protein SAMN00808754_1757 [Thermanaeromonas toyohensis ToBE]|uniref:Aspartyl protease n=1 Tax=Thermanaeromonas toyohensis ToBE TaxID=698762 RepID=A0A1W1VUR8_9FIRM|nr:retropepsin-like aspartic protease [Thermanaeromonas toyohensis]SMB97099.1 hypothetical protein SAMN00808754_1757 [Thermanaeromonas toyohensis ToBE]
MGLVYIEGKAIGPTGISREVRFLVNSGATHSLLPPDVWQAIQLEPKRRATFVLADGTSIDRNISECYRAAAGRPYPFRGRDESGGCGGIKL